MTDCFIGIDIGSTSTIGVAIALPDKELSRVSLPSPMVTTEAGWLEGDPEKWWDNCCSVIPQLIKNAGIKAADVKGVGVTGMLPVAVLLDEDDNLLQRSIQQSDGRSAEEIIEISQEIDEEEFVRRTGNGINQQLIAPRIRWLENNKPEIFEKIATVFGSYDFINWKLTGKKAIEKNYALEAGFLDFETGLLADDLIELAHLKRDSVPDISLGHEVLGNVTQKAANETGLLVGTPVTGGVADHISSAYVAGITKPGDALLKFGGAIDILIASDNPEPDRRMFLDYHLIPDLYMPNGCMANGGLSLARFVEMIVLDDVFAKENKLVSLDYDVAQIYHVLDHLASKTPVGSEGLILLPYFLGEKTPIHNPDAKGMLYGITHSHHKGHFWRAMLESFGYCFRHNLEVFEERGHGPIKKFFASDGGSKSKFWMQICADILKSPVQLLKGHPGSSLGAAYLAAIATNYTQDWMGVSKFITHDELLEPQTEYNEIYDEGYRKYRAFYNAIEDTLIKI